MDRGPRWLVALCASALLLTALAAPAMASDGSGSGSGARIGFDDRSAPCVFADTIALKAGYASAGVLFKGPGPNDGGGILNECSNFGVTGYSRPNFLAFNADSFYANGGVPTPPETLLFSPNVSHVQMLVGSGSGGQLIVRAFDASRGLLATVTVTLGSAMQAVHIDTAGIASVRIDGADVWVLDNLETS